MTNPPIKFLLVDDLEANLIALEGLLRRDGLELLKAHSGPEALELLLVHDVALALLDVQMAGMDGFELAELMRGTERTRRIPIIFLTAGAIDHQRRFRGYEAGAVDFIFKPIEPHILQSKAGIFFELALQRETLRQRAEEAQAASRAKDDFLAALSHELRTPLTPVLMTAAALESDPTLPLEIRGQLSMMRRNIELEARLIDDLLDITRISRGKLSVAPEPTDLHSLLRHTVEIVRSDGLGHGLKICFALDAAHHHALVDPARIQQVFWNLIKNALKFTPEGGRVTVRTRDDAERRVIISVEDTGVWASVRPPCRTSFAPLSRATWPGSTSAAASASASPFHRRSWKCMAASSGPRARGRNRVLSSPCPSRRCPRPTRPPASQSIRFPTLPGCACSSWRTMKPRRTCWPAC